jgi:hypothetical protein
MVDLPRESINHAVQDGGFWCSKILLASAETSAFLCNLCEAKKPNCRLVCEIDLAGRK